MNLSTVSAHTVMITEVGVISVTLRYSLDGLLRFIAGIATILARGTRPRSERALDVLNALRRSRQDKGEDLPLILSVRACLLLVSPI